MDKSKISTKIISDIKIFFTNTKKLFNNQDDELSKLLESDHYKRSDYRIVKFIDGNYGILIGCTENNYSQLVDLTSAAYIINDKYLSNADWRCMTKNKKKLISSYYERNPIPIELISIL